MRSLAKIATITNETTTTPAAAYRYRASEIGRSLSYGLPPGSWPVGWHYVVLVAYAVAGWVLAHRVFRRRLR